MAKLINKLIICVFFGISFSPFVSADDLLFEDEVLFEESSQEFDEWSDDSDLFGDEIKNARPFAWLNIGVTQKWGFNPASDWSTTKERTELILGTTGSVSDAGYGELEIKATKYWSSDSHHSTEASDIEIERAFLQFSFDKWSTKLGRYTT